MTETLVKKKTTRKVKKYLDEDIESKPSSGRQSSAPKKQKKTGKTKTPFDKELKEKEFYAIDLVHPKTDVIQVFKKDATAVQVNVLGIHLIAQTLDFYKKEGWSYLDTAINPNGTCWIILEKLEEE